MILVGCLVLVVLSVPLTGGKLRHVLRLRLRSGWLVGVALVLQTVVISVLPRIVPPFAGEVVHLGTYALAVAFLWRNRHIAWLWLVAFGGGLNLLAISVNHGVMPASRAALVRAGMADTTGFANSAPVPNARLAFLGDVFAVPHGLPLANVFSIGDVVLVVGAGMLLHCAARPRLEAEVDAVPRPVPEPILSTWSADVVAEIERDHRRTVVHLVSGSSLHRVENGSSIEIRLPGGVIVCDGGTVGSMIDDNGATTIVVLDGNAVVQAGSDIEHLSARDTMLVSSDGHIRDWIRATDAELRNDPWLAAHAFDDQGSLALTS